LKGDDSGIAVGSGAQVSGLEPVQISLLEKLMNSSSHYDFTTNLKALKDQWTAGFVKYLEDETDIVNSRLEQAINNLRMNIWSPAMYLEFLRSIFKSEETLAHYYVKQLTVVKE